ALHRRKAAKLLEVAKLVTKLADLLDHGHVAKLPELLLKRAEVCLRFPVLCGIERALHALLERVEASLKRCEPHRLDAAADRADRFLQVVNRRLRFARLLLDLLDSFRGLLGGLGEVANVGSLDLRRRLRERIDLAL